MLLVHRFQQQQSNSLSASKIVARDSQLWADRMHIFTVKPLSVNIEVLLQGEKADQRALPNTNKTPEIAMGRVKYPPFLAISV